MIYFELIFTYIVSTLSNYMQIIIPDLIEEKVAK